MARVTIEDCLDNVENRYELVHVCTKRARQLYRGSDPLIQCKNNEVVTTLREIAAGYVKPMPRLAMPSELPVDDSNLTQ